MLTAEEIARAEKMHARNRLLSGNPQVQPYPTHLELFDGLYYRSWVNIGDSFREVDEYINFWYGDWLLYGRKHYGERYAQGAEVLGKPPDTLRQYAYISRSYRPEDRVRGVSWRGHQIVAGMRDREARHALLEGAREAALPVSAIRALYAAYKEQLLLTAGTLEETATIECDNPDSVFAPTIYHCPNCGHTFKKEDLNELLENE